MKAKLTNFPTYKENRAYYQRKKPMIHSYLNSLENKSDRMGFTIGTNHDAAIHISFYDYEPFPQVVCAEMILDFNTKNPRIRSITAMMRKNVTLRTFIENETIAYLEDRNDKLQAQMYLEYYDDRKDYELEKFFHEREVN